MLMTDTGLGSPWQSLGPGFCLERVLGWEGPDWLQQSSAGGTGGSQVGAGSPKVQEGPDVVVPGEGPKQLTTLVRYFCPLGGRGRQAVSPSTHPSLSDHPVLPSREERGSQVQWQGRP